MQDEDNKDFAIEVKENIGFSTKWLEDDDSSSEDDTEVIIRPQGYIYLYCFKL